MLILRLWATLAREFNLYTSDTLLSLVWEPSVGLPDTRSPYIPTDLCERRWRIKERLSKKSTVTLQEFQNNLDIFFPGYGIWLATGETANSFRYTFSYSFAHGGVRDRLTIYVHIPWFAIDPNDVENSPITWENLLRFLRDFSPAYVMYIPVYEEQASYCVITNPQNSEPIFINSDGVGGWEPTPVYWKEIDINGSAVDHLDYESVTPSTTEITRSFTDSTSALIEDSILIDVLPLL
jgi:hypothetical protein